jgi:hypothetical protein
MAVLSTHHLLHFVRILLISALLNRIKGFSMFFRAIFIVQFLNIFTVQTFLPVYYVRGLQINQCRLRSFGSAHIFWGSIGHKWPCLSCLFLTPCPKALVNCVNGGVDWLLIDECHLV